VRWRWLSACAWPRWHPTHGKRGAPPPSPATPPTWPGAWPPEEAAARATALFAELVPDGPATAGHEFRSVVAADGTAVGALWFAAEGEPGHGTAFIWDIVVEPAFRGRGYGRAALDALDRLARSMGYRAVRLHVFGDNETARGLYRSAGYEETDVTMLKRLSRG